MNATHTALPLAYNATAKIIVDNAGKTCASIHGIGQDRLAGYMVNAANSHEELLGALQESVEMLTTIASELADFKDSARAHSLRVLAARQQTAIAHATADQTYGPPLAKYFVAPSLLSEAPAAKKIGRKAHATGE